VRTRKRKLIHSQLNKDRYLLKFRGGVIGTIDRVWIKGKPNYHFYPDYGGLAGEAGSVDAKTMKILKEQVMATIPADLPPAPGMPCIDG